MVVVGFFPLRAAPGKAYVRASGHGDGSGRWLVSGGGDGYGRTGFVAGGDVALGRDGSHRNFVHHSSPCRTFGCPAVAGAFGSDLAPATGMRCGLRVNPVFSRGMDSKPVS